MPWLQIKAWGEKAQWKPGRVTHIQHYIVASSPAARCLLLPCRKHRNFTSSASASCQLWGSRCTRCPTSPCRCQPFFPRRFDGKCQHLSPWSMRTFRSYVSGSDTSAVGCLVRNHQVTLRAAVYQHSALIKGEEVRRVLLASKCFHTLDCTTTASSTPSFLACFLLCSTGIKSFEVKQQGGKYLPLWTLMCVDLLLKTIGSTKGGYAACAKVLMKLAVLCSS